MGFDLQPICYSYDAEPYIECKCEKCVIYQFHSSNTTFSNFLREVEKALNLTTGLWKVIHNLDENNHTLNDIQNAYDQIKDLNILLFKPKFDSHLILITKIFSYCLKNNILLMSSC